MWPSVWDGLWKQVRLDVPRMTVIFDGRQWRNPFELLVALERQWGVVWSRWLCVFTNQSPMSDVVMTITRDLETQYTATRNGGSIVLSDKGTLLIDIADDMSVTMHKGFWVQDLNWADDDPVRIGWVVCVYSIDPCTGSANLRWTFHDTDEDD